MVITLQVHHNLYVLLKEKSSSKVKIKGKVSGIIGIEREGFKERKLPWAASQKSLQKE